METLALPEYRVDLLRPFAHGAQLDSNGRIGKARVARLRFGQKMPRGTHGETREDRCAAADSLARPGAAMKLISATPSPYARKVRIALAEKGIPFELITEVPWDSTTTVPRYNPLEKLPVLLPDDGRSVYDSSHILEWLDAKFPDPPLLPATADDRLEAKRCMVIGDGVCDAFLLVFFERLRPPEHQSAPWITRQMRKIDGGLADMARTVGERTFAVGDRFSHGDIAFGCVLGYLSVRFPELAWRSTHPGLALYYDALAERRSFRDTVPYPQRISDAVV
jgi:glutathione S-transferase